MPKTVTKKLYKLETPKGQVLSETPGEIGGHKGLRIYGRLDCPSALRWIKAGKYVDKRVFFKDIATAAKCGYRPCGVCMPELYAVWKALMANKRTPIKTLCSCCQKKISLFWPQNCFLNGKKLTPVELIGHALRTDYILLICDKCLLKIPLQTRMEDIWLG